MSQPHPTIPGVTVTMHESPDGPRDPVMFRRLQDRLGNVIIASSLGFWTCANSVRDDHTSSVLEMIRDQAAWLAEQNGGAE